MFKNAYFFLLKALFILEMFTFLYSPFGYAEKRLDKKPMANFEIYDVTDWTLNNYNTHIAQYLMK